MADTLLTGHTGPSNVMNAQEIDLTKSQGKESDVEALATHGEEKERVLRLSHAKICELTSSPESLPIITVSKETDSELQSATLSKIPPILFGQSSSEMRKPRHEDGILSIAHSGPPAKLNTQKMANLQAPLILMGESGDPMSSSSVPCIRPAALTRALSTPLPTKITRPPMKHGLPQDRQMPSKTRGTPSALNFDTENTFIKTSIQNNAIPSPMPSSIPLPPLSIPTYLQLELSSQRPSPLYIHRSATSDFPYESSRVKIERLLNFLLLPPQLEVVLWFGTLACLDAWLYTFTILPLRLLKSSYILWQSWIADLITEARFVSSFVYKGAGRMWQRRRARESLSGKRGKKQKGSVANLGSITDTKLDPKHCIEDLKQQSHTAVSNSDTVSDSRKLRTHHRSNSVPSALLPNDKADILKGFLIIWTCIFLMRLDASRMYHWIRGQAAIKLYVIYNVLEVGDRLLSAIGQDVLECLFSREALERKPDGHSKVLRPFWLFLLALVYTSVHTTALFYQVITLNVAVNSYSNALITLLMSNQFVEIKSTVFKKFEKENLFQLTCADVVERFHLWLMLVIIASRNIVETGGLSMGFSVLTSSSSFSTGSATNTSNTVSQTTATRSSTSILPRSFTLLPTLLSSLTAYAPTFGHVLGPFLVVLGSEMLVDWLKHAYISKFNNTRPAIYGRFLDVLAKDYYTNAFADPNLTKRLGLPVIPLSCLFIRASVQTYHMFQAAWVPPPAQSSTRGLTSLHNNYTSSTSSTPRSTSATLSQKFDELLRYVPSAITSSPVVVNFTSILMFLLFFLVLLAFKLVLGMVLLSFARARYRSMKQREKHPVHHVEGGKRLGGWGVVEVDDDKRRWIYDGEGDGARATKEREESDRQRREKGHGEGAFEKVKRYEMVAKRIW